MSKENEVTVDVSVGRRDDREDLGEAAFNLNENGDVLCDNQEGDYDTIASLGLPAAVEEGKEEEYSNGEGADKEGKEEDSAAEGADKVAAIPIVEEEEKEGDGWEWLMKFSLLLLVWLLVTWVGDKLNAMPNHGWVAMFWLCYYLFF